MNIVVLTQVSGILKPLAWIMGIILNAIYEFFSMFGIQNIALCIFVFTFVIKMLMLPLTIKQQKFSRLSAKMNPELTKIQEKYKGKKDEVSMRNMQAEQQEVYAKYGTNPIGGCLPLLISLPIMIALYKVMYAIPAYVNDIGSLYGQVANLIQSLSGHADELLQFIADQSITVSSDITENFATFVVGSKEYTNNLIDVLVKFTAENWNALFATDFFAGIQASSADAVAQILSVNNLFGLNILNTPQLWPISITWLIPLLAVVTQYIQGKLQAVNSPQKDNQRDEDNPAAGMTKSMTTIMPIMSGAFCFMFPIGVGLYWIASALFTIIQTLFINKYLDKTDLDDMIAKNVEKAKKRSAKFGIDYGNTMAQVAKTTTKSYDTSYDNSGYKKNNKRRSATGLDYKRSDVSYSASSIAANANLLSGRSADKKEQQSSSCDTEDNN